MKIVMKYLNLIQRVDRVCLLSTVFPTPGQLVKEIFKKKNRLLSVFVSLKIKFKVPCLYFYFAFRLKIEFENSYFIFQLKSKVIKNIQN